MANPVSLQERIPEENTLQRALDLLIFFLLLSVLLYRLSSLHQHGVVWFLAFLCESWFTFMCVLHMNAKWNPVEFKTYPERLLQRVPELPPVDIFVTTADPVLEPPIITVNTVLSLLAVEYPADKLACYVSDDGCSPLTFYSLIEASKFAKLWVPFCKKYSVRVRAPFRYFSTEVKSWEDVSSDFQHEWTKMKNEYEQLSQRINNAELVPCELTGEFAAFSKVERRNHPSIIKVIWENKDNCRDAVPHLVYISREKRPKHPHHFKAGAMNVLTRVSGVMTNAPFMLNVDCDMFVNNAEVMLHAMCLHLGFEDERKCAFVQFPQRFYGGLKDDPFGNHSSAAHESLLRGISGLQGMLYAGTGCFHRRKIIYGSSPDDKSELMSESDEALTRKFGNSKELTTSVAQIFSGKTKKLEDISSSLEAAERVMGCGYENGTSWGTKVGWVYGSATEDVLTGQGIHARGWETTHCTPDPPAFLGCAPSLSTGCSVQMKRWCTGLLEILFSNNSPVLATLTRKLQFRQCLVYLFIYVWGLRSLPESCYAVLPAYCILVNTHFLPKVSEPAIFLYSGLFIIQNVRGLSEYLRHGYSARVWWNSQRIRRIHSATACLFGLIGCILKLLGLSETMFEVTQKDQSTNEDGTDANAGRFTFDDSPLFVSGTALMLLHLTAPVVGLLGLQPPARVGDGPGLGEVICSAWMVLSFMPFVKGLFGKGKYGIPAATIFKSAVLVLLFVHFSLWTSPG